MHICRIRRWLKDLSILWIYIWSFTWFESENRFFFINPAQVGSLHLHHWKMFFISIQGGRVLTDTNRNEKVFSFSVFSTRTKKMHILTGIEGITTCRRKKERQPFRRQKDNSVLINSRKQSVRLTIFYESWSTCGLRSRFFSAVQIYSVCLSLNGRV